MSTFTQFVSDDTTPTDSISKAPYIPMIESAAIAESISKDTSRSLVDAETVADVLLKMPGKKLAETLSCSDSLPARIIGKVLADVESIADSLSRRWVLARSYSDAAPITDSISKGPAKAPFIEARIVLTDSIGRLMNKVASELFSLSDELVWPSNPRIMGTISTALRFIGKIIIGD